MFVSHSLFQELIFSFLFIQMCKPFQKCHIDMAITLIIITFFFFLFSFHIFKTTTHKIYQKNFKGFERALTLVLMTLQQNRNLRFRFILLFLLFLWSFQFLFIRFDMNFIEVIQKQFQRHLNYSPDSPILFSCPEMCFYAVLFLSWKQYNQSEPASKFWICMACETSVAFIRKIM